MESIFFLIESWQMELVFGVMLNFVLTFGFGVYKAMNLSYDQTVVLMDKYPVKPSHTKILAFWFVPYLGAVYIFKELLILQRFIKFGGGVYEYLDNKLNYDYNRQKSRANNDE